MTTSHEVTIDGRGSTEYNEQFLDTLPVGTTLRNNGGHEFVRLPDRTWYDAEDEADYTNTELAHLIPLTAVHIPPSPCRRSHMTEPLVRKMATLIARHSNTDAAWSDWKALLGPGITALVPKETAHTPFQVWRIDGTPNEKTEALDQLPIGTVVIDPDGWPWRKEGPDGRAWRLPTFDARCEPTHAMAEAEDWFTVVYVPEEDA